jgi:hypothetical protein
LWICDLPGGGAPAYALIVPVTLGSVSITRRGMCGLAVLFGCVVLGGCGRPAARVVPAPPGLPKSLQALLSARSLTTLVRGVAANGVPFSIEANPGDPSRHIGFCFSPGTVARTGSVWHQGTASPFCPQDEAGPFAVDDFVPCKPHPFQLIYGLVRDDSASISIRAGSHELPVTHQPIPAAMHTTGSLAYTVTTLLSPVLITISGADQHPALHYKIGTPGAIASTCATGAGGIGQPLYREPGNISLRP